MTARTAERDRIEVAGVPVDVVDRQGVHRWIAEAVATRPRPGLRLATVNLDYLVQAERSSAFRAALAAAQLTVADGAPVLWLARRAGRRLPERVAGSDLTEWLVTGGIPRASLFLLGSTDAVCRAVARRAEAAGVRIAGWNTSPAEVFDDPARSAALVAEINTTSPDILLIALGAPRQDLWLERFQPSLDVSVMLGIGGSLDIAAGNLRRAPRLVQRLGLEWAFRMAQEPGRLFRRYMLDDLPFLVRKAIGPAGRGSPG